MGERAPRRVRLATLADHVDAFADALAEAQHELRRAAEEAERHGLVLRGAEVVQAWGISGEASGELRRQTDERAARLERRVARVLALLERRRTALTQATADFTGSLP